MTIDNALTDKTVRIFDKMFEYIHNIYTIKMYHF